MEEENKETQETQPTQQTQATGNDAPTAEDMAVIKAQLQAEGDALRAERSNLQRALAEKDAVVADLQAQLSEAKQATESLRAEGVAISSSPPTLARSSSTSWKSPTPGLALQTRISVCWRLKPTTAAARANTSKSSRWGRHDLFPVLAN